MRKRKRKLYFKNGPVKQKVLTLLCAGAALSLSRSPQGQWRIMKSAYREWNRINQRSLRDAIKKLYQSRLVEYKENRDGTVTLALNEDGRKTALRYDLENIKIEKPTRWDGLWRIVIFDIPEPFKKGRDALASKLKHLGFMAIQKSVFIYPYECRKEIDFIVEIFDLRQFVRFIIAKETDIDLDLKNKFGVK
jgi:DNA-binding transcriptional regulator PaaX